MNKSYQTIGRRWVFALACLFLTAAAVPGHAASPNPGTYLSEDDGGPLYIGHASVSRTGPNTGGPYILHVQSWGPEAGTPLLGTQWSFTCSSAPDYQEILDVDANGDGNVTYISDYIGGRFHFVAGPWSDTPVDGDITSIHEVVTIQLDNFQPSSPARINALASGQFDNGCALTYTIADGGRNACETAAPPNPNPSCPLDATYPTFLDDTASCLPTRVFGRWGDVYHLEFKVECPTPAQASTWGALKTLYR